MLAAVILPLSFIAGLYCLLLVLVFIFQARLLYFPSLPGRHLAALPTDAGLDYDNIHITTSDDVLLNGWFLPCFQDRGTVLFLHGNAGNISHRLDSLKIFHGLGLNILIIDYRGYGLSQGTPSEQGTYLDAEAAWLYLRQERDIPANRIIIFGRSLGGAVAAHLASSQRPAALIIESTFTSAADVAADLYPWLPARWLCRFRYNTLQTIASIDCPLLIVHSDDDEVIPAAHGRKIYGAASMPKELLIIRGSHDTGFLVSGRTYTDGINHFLATYLSNRL
jgi:fermentation-respiration switch protein FrsA (DUF1100 family)